MNQKGMNMEVVKRRNRSSILELIVRTGSTSRKDIAAELGLTPAAVTQICGEFLESGILVEKGTLEEENRSGRKKVLLDIDYDFKYVFGINIEPEKTTVALTNLKGDACEIRTVSTEKEIEPELFLKQIAGLCMEMQQKLGFEKKQIAGAGVGITGIVEKHTGTSIHAYGIWNREVKAAEVLEKCLDIPVIVENNVTAFALAELFFGIGKEKDHLLFVKWGPGVGSAIIADKKIYEGRNGKAAELGHYIIEKNGKKCSCGRRGCLETKVSLSALKEQFGEILSEQHTPNLYHMVEGDIKNLSRESFEQIYEHIDEAVEQVMDASLDLFARAVVNTVTILAPNRVVLCGTLFRSKEIRNRMISMCSSYEPKYNEKKIVWTSLGEQEAYIGPVALFVKENLSFLLK